MSKVGLQMFFETGPNDHNFPTMCVVIMVNKVRPYL
jgi:hypothetical protein